MAVLPPYHLRHLPVQTEFTMATNNARCKRWLPVLILLSLRGFTDYQIGRLLGLREEYESGVERKG
jgi:hypothetical protein